MTRSQRRLTWLGLGVVGLLLGCALAYQFGMTFLEGRPRDFWRALEWAAESLSTTGYGADSTWTHPVMVVFVVVVQFVGVLLVFLVVPVYLIPFLEERFERRLPKEAPSIGGHVVIYRSGAAVETLVTDLQAAGVSPLVIEPDEGRARRLLERKVPLVFGDLRDGVLSRVRLSSALALVLNGSDDENALAALEARQSGFARDVVALVEEPEHRKALQLAGANRVFTPRHALGAALAARASRRVHPSVAGLGALGSKLQVAELRVTAKSPVAGKSLAEAGIGTEFGVTVLGLWARGRLEPDAGAETLLEPGSIVIVAGSEERLARFAEILTANEETHRPGRFLIAGLGEVGRTARDVLVSVGEEVVTIDRRAETKPDIVGNFLDPEVAGRADPRRADAVLLALDADSSTLFAALVVRDLAPHVSIVARVNEAANVERIHLAGADFALSISQVAGQIVGHQILAEESISVEPGLRVRALHVDSIAGRTLGELGLRERTGCSAVALERGDELLVRLAEATPFERGDKLYVCGSAESIRRASALVSPNGQPPAAFSSKRA